MEEARPLGGIIRVDNDLGCLSELALDRSTGCDKTLGQSGSNRCFFLNREAAAVLQVPPLFHAVLKGDTCCLLDSGINPGIQGNLKETMQLTGHKLGLQGEEQPRVDRGLGHHSLMAMQTVQSGTC